MPRVSSAVRLALKLPRLVRIVRRVRHRSVEVRHNSSAGKRASKARWVRFRGNLAMSVHQHLVGVDAYRRCTAPNSVSTISLTRPSENKWAIRTARHGRARKSGALQYSRILLRLPQDKSLQASLLCGEMIRKPRVGCRRQRRLAISDGAINLITQD